MISNSCPRVRVEGKGPRGLSCQLKGSSRLAFTHDIRLKVVVRVEQVNRLLDHRVDLVVADMNLAHLDAVYTGAGRKGERVNKGNKGVKVCVPGTAALLCCWLV